MTCLRELFIKCQCKESKTNRGHSDLPKSHMLPNPEGCWETWASPQSVDFMHFTGSPPLQQHSEGSGKESFVLPLTDVLHQWQRCLGTSLPVCTQTSRHCLPAAPGVTRSRNLVTTTDFSFVITVTVLWSYAKAQVHMVQHFL